MKIPGSGAFLRVKNWSTYQHYKDRNPPWIKLHVELLDDYEFGCLQDASKALALCTMLLAARTENHIPNDAEWVAKKISATSPVDLDLLVTLGFLEVCDCEQCASAALAARKQTARPEAEAYKEETEREPPLPPAAPPALPADAGGRTGRKSKDKGEPEDFVKFYSAFPRKVERAGACAKWKTLEASGALPPLPDLLAALEAQKQSADWTKESGRFIPHPTTWLNGRRWQDQGLDLAALSTAAGAPAALPPQPEPGTVLDPNNISEGWVLHQANLDGKHWPGSRQEYRKELEDRGMTRPEAEAKCEEALAEYYRRTGKAPTPAPELRRPSLSPQAPLVLMPAQVAH